MNTISVILEILKDIILFGTIMKMIMEHNKLTYSLQDKLMMQYILQQRIILSKLSLNLACLIIYLLKLSSLYHIMELIILKIFMILVLILW